MFAALNIPNRSLFIIFLQRRSMSVALLNSKQCGGHRLPLQFAPPARRRRNCHRSCTKVGARTKRSQAGLRFKSVSTVTIFHLLGALASRRRVDTSVASQQAGETPALPEEECFLKPCTPDVLGSNCP